MIFFFFFGNILLTAKFWTKDIPAQSQIEQKSEIEIAYDGKGVCFVE